MDLWIFGAATAAGYIAKYWQNVSRDKERDSSLELSSGAFNCEKPEISSCPFRRLTGRKKEAEDASTNRRKVLDEGLSDMYWLDSASDAEAVSTSGRGERLGRQGSFRNDNSDFSVLSMSSLSPEFPTNENLEQNELENGLSGGMDDNNGEANAGEMDFFPGPGRNKRSFRTKHSYGYVVKPLSSLDSCLMAQLYEEHARMEEYMLSAFPSPSSIMRPLLITDGSRIISRANDDNRQHKEEMVCGVPPLAIKGTLDLPKRIKSKTGKGCSERSNSFYKTSYGKHISSHNANRREVDKLKDVLKQTENLVQDLQEELEMKDSLTVKELTNDNTESQDTRQNSFQYRTSNPLFPVQNVDNSTNNNGIESYNENAEESSESMSKIEAELEAELERLGLNMDTSGLERRLPDLVEIDPNFVADFAQGELKPSMVNGHSVAHSDSNRDASSTSTTHSGNYVVSPRELSLRLHEVIQLRLEERVKELERALQNSERKVQLMQSERKNVGRIVSCTELRYSSGEESPVARGDCNHMTQPLVMNLSGEALDAHNEAYEELNKMNESEEDDSPSGVYEDNLQVGSHLFDQSFLSGQNVWANDSCSHFLPNYEKTSNQLHISPVKTSAECGSRIEELLYDGATEDEDSECEDEMERQLIKHIVERTRKGSPVVLNAQKLLLSMNDNEH